MKGKIVSFQSKFGKIEKFNSQFAKCNVAIAYHGDNRNYTSISKEVFEKAIPSLYGVPIVGEWKKDNEDFGSHGGKIEITDDGVEYVETTRPFGFIDSQSKVWWENVTEEDGTVKEYLHTECFLWTGRYPEAEKVLEGNSNQSMEIYVSSGKSRDDGYYEIDNFEFSALCILGSEVEPAFESAGFSQFNYNEEKFKKEFNLMVQELKASLVEGGENDMDKDKGLNDETIEEKFEEEDKEEDKEEKENETIENTEEVTENSKDEKDEDEFEEDDNKEVESEKEDNSKDEDFTKDDFEELAEKYAVLESEFTALEKEAKELREYKNKIEREQKQNQINEVFAKYSELLSKSDVEDLEENAMDMDIVDLEKELSFRVVQAKFNFTKVNKKDSTKVPIVDNEETQEPYGSASVYFK